MKRPALVLAIGLVGALGPSASATAQSGAGVFFAFGPGQTTVTPVRVHGSLNVDFRGDPGSGCAAAGLCAYAGTVDWHPPAQAALIVNRYVQHGKRRLDGALIFETALFNGGTGAVAQVGRTAPDGSAAVCSDVSPANDPFVGLATRDNKLELGFGPHSDPLGLVPTHCASPLEADIRSVLPGVVLTQRQLARGRLTADLTADRAISAHGFAMRIRSSLLLKLGRPAKQTGGKPPPGTRVRVVHRRFRYLDVQYAVERLSGTVRTLFSGLADDNLCSPLDSCGTSGELTFAPGTTTGRIDLSTEARASRPRRDLLASVGLAKSHRAARAEGFGDLTAHGATISSSFQRRDGSPPCIDSMPVSGASLELVSRAGRLRATYGESSVSGQDPLRTRCPGPGLDQPFGDGGGLLGGSVPLNALAHRRVTIPLDRGAVLSGNGYRARVATGLNLVLRRVRVRERVVTEAIPIYSFGP